MLKQLWQTYDERMHLNKDSGLLCVIWLIAMAAALTVNWLGYPGVGGWLFALGWIIPVAYVTPHAIWWAIQKNRRR